MVARTAPFGGVIAPTAADAEEAVAGGTVARDAARRFLGLEAPPFLIAAQSPGTSPAAGCTFVFPWHFPQAVAGGRRLPPQVLPHEIGHALFIRFLVPETGKEEYGGGAPDWLDEMAAIAFESPGGVRKRRIEARDAAERGALMPLARLLSMPHPEWSARRAQASAAPEPRTGPPRSTDTPAFYATLRALLDFLIERTGDERVIKRLAEQARADAPLDRWLLAHVPGAAGKGLSRLDAQIAAFVLTNPAYDEARENEAAEETRPTPGRDELGGRPRSK
ncbi:MAG TPA: hypothetical protein VF650_16010 [Allosphingosinicella sp.]|jgi:hypothetical protein